MKRLGLALLALAAILWWLSRPIGGSEAVTNHEVDVSNGEQVFWAGGCASCHASPVDGRRATGDAKLNLGGGLELDTAFGLFRVPNISSDIDAGIGAWSDREFVDAMQHGVSPGGQHYYPSFPYASYARMQTTDVLDLKAYLDTLPAIGTVTLSHELNFPWSIRRGVGFWKRLYMSTGPIVSVPENDSLLRRGRELVEGVGHCGECHTPRTPLGGMDESQWLTGAANPDGAGKIPDITPASKTIGDWSDDDLAYYFESGFTPDFDTVGGSMVAVQENLAMLTSDDRLAIAMYLKALAPPDGER